MATPTTDNSITALSLDFLGGEPLWQAPQVQPEAPAPCAGGRAASAAKAAERPAQAEPEAVPAERPVQVEPEAVPAEPAPAAQAAAAGEVVTAEVRVVSAPKRHAWSLFYLVRNLLIAAVLFCASAVLLTMALNPDLTFSEAIALLLQRSEVVLWQIEELFR